MSEYDQAGLRLTDEQIANIFGGTKAWDCQVTAVQFPESGSCCTTGASPAGNQYHKLCPFLCTWSSLPDSTSLEITHILECDKFGYCKRIKQQN